MFSVSNYRESINFLIAALFVNLKNQIDKVTNLSAYGSYMTHQKSTAIKALTGQTEKLSGFKDFLEEVDDNYFLENRATLNTIGKYLIYSLKDYPDLPFNDLYNQIKENHDVLDDIVQFYQEQNVENSSI